ncbi:MAG TPA: ABC-2 family transporter protein [Candidatus Acidoferrales bacterium]|nr:ABC-2 family transporter protein [Candidatus Acidoferrales bacterium]
MLAPYVEFAKKAFAREATYRAEVFTNVASLIVRVYLLRSVWTALYLHNAAPPGMALHAMLTYATIALLMSLVLEIDGTRVIRDKIREGTIVTDLLKPISLPFYFFSDGFGQAAFHAMTIVPSLLLALLIVRIDVPSPRVFAAFALSFVLGYLVNFLVNFLMNSVAFWTLETFSVQLIVRWISDLLSGQIVPLIFFPAAVQSIMLSLPFAAIYSTPLLIYVGTIEPRGYAQALGGQLAWLVVFAAAAIAVWRAAQRRIVVQGG